MTRIVTLDDADALADILSAVQRKSVVAYLLPGRDRVLYGSAQYIGGPSLMRPDYPAERASDVRELYLYVKSASPSHPGLMTWLIGDLITAHQDFTFITDFDVAAFEAAGGQDAVRKSETRAIPGWFGTGTSGQPEPAWHVTVNMVVTEHTPGPGYALETARKRILGLLPDAEIGTIHAKFADEDSGQPEHHLKGTP